MVKNLVFSAAGFFFYIFVLLTVLYRGAALFHGRIVI